MSDNNKAIKVSTSGSMHDNELVTLFPGDSRFDIRFPGMPTELTYKLPDGIEFGYSLFYEFSKRFDDQLDEIFKKHGSEAMKKARRAMSETLFPKDERGTRDIDEEVKAELAEIIEHLTSLLKAKMLEYVHAKHTAELKRMEDHAVTTKKMLSNVLENGPSVIDDSEWFK